MLFIYNILKLLTYYTHLSTSKHICSNKSTFLANPVLIQYFEKQVLIENCNQLISFQEITSITQLISKIFCSKSQRHKKCRNQLLVVVSFQKLRQNEKGQWYTHGKNVKFKCHISSMLQNCKNYNGAKIQCNTLCTTLNLVPSIT